MSAKMLPSIFCSKLLQRGFRTSAKLQSHNLAYTNLWRRCTMFLAIPGTLAFSIYTFMTLEHEKRPEFVAYEYLRIRTKPFPWGDGNRTLMHNPKINALPDGYETEEEEH